ncbi:F-box protein CPR1-like isoform X2 [Silene latifolia]|uniref:F-box protein CPR1-like isoform X2 n=1 Tax=Silene latifolia TaxID=37657 RepID=UPI003D770264
MDSRLKNHHSMRCSSMAIPTLPSDIITDILSRLPSKTLIRFKSVSKQWYSLINSPNFINLHLTQTLISQNSPNLIISQFSLSSVTISDENNPNFHLTELDHPLKHFCKTHNFSSYDPEHMPQILGSINGVVCISMYDKSSVVLYNPSTKTHRFIPPFTPSPNTNPYSEINPEGTTVNVVVFGFGFDSVNGDYKLLRMIDTVMKSVLVYGETSVYSLRNDSWKCVHDQTMMDEFLFQNSMGVFVNDVLHFIGVDGNLKPKVKCFDIRTETFLFMDLPNFDERFITHDIQELDGCLSVIVNCKKIDRSIAGHFALARVDLWVMKEYGNKESWFRLFSICDPAKLEVLNQVRPVVYSRDKERVLLELDSMSFGWYSWGSKSFERSTVHGLSSSPPPCETWTFVDSLVSIEMGKDRSKPKVVPKKNKNKDDFLSSGFKLRL